MATPTADEADPVSSGAPRAHRPTLGDLVGDVAEDVSTLVRHEIELAKAEVRVEVAKAAHAAGAFGAAAAAGLMIVPLLSLTLVRLFDNLLSPVWAALMVTAIWVLVAAVGAFVGVRIVRTVLPVPGQAIESVKEDVRWLRSPRS